MSDDGKRIHDEPGIGEGPDERERPIGDLASRLIRAGAEAVSAGAEKLREKGESAASLTARGKEEVMTLLAKEVRSYVEKLRLGDELRDLLTDYTLEIRASIDLQPKPVGAADPPTDEKPMVVQDGVGLDVGVARKPTAPPVEPELQLPVKVEPAPVARRKATSRATPAARTKPRAPRKKRTTRKKAQEEK
jgi:hypothetical protein